MRMASEDPWPRRRALVVSPEHIDTLWRDRWTKDDLRKRIQEITSRPLRELLPTEDYGGLGAMPEQVALARNRSEEKLNRMVPKFKSPKNIHIMHGRTQEKLNRLMPKFKSPKNIHIIVAGGPAGKWSSVFNGFGDSAARCRSAVKSRRSYNERFLTRPTNAYRSDARWRPVPRASRYRRTAGHQQGARRCDAPACAATPESIVAKRRSQTLSQAHAGSPRRQ